MARISVKVEEKDMGWKKIKREVKKFQNSSTSIGYFSNGVGGPDKNIAARAMVQETGATIKVTSKMRGWWLYNHGTMLKKTALVIPKRPFMRQTFDKNKKKIFKEVEKNYDRVLAGRSTAKQALSRLGEWYVGRIKMTITNGRFKSLSPFTIMKKKSAKPLMDKGEMRRATTHREKIRGR